MKKIISVVVAIAITAGAYAQADSTNRKMSPKDITKNQNQNIQNNSVDKSNPDGVMMQNGKMMMVKNGQRTFLDHEMTMGNGTKIMSDGTYIKADGTKMKMNEGQQIDMSGNMLMKTTTDKNLDLNKTIQNNSNDQSNSDGVVMQNGKMMMVKNGQRTILVQNMTFRNGTKIMSDGTYIKADGTKVKMNEGQHIDMSGNMMLMKTNTDKNMDLIQNMQNTPVDKSNSDGVVMQNGKMMMVKNGQRTILYQNMTLRNGTKIMSDGTCIKTDGTKVTMKEGEHMDMAGNMFSMRTNIDKNMYLVPDSILK